MTVSFRFPGLPAAILSAIGFFGLPPLPGFGPRCPIFHTSFVGQGLFPQKLTRICTRRPTPVVRRISRRDFDRPTRWVDCASDHHVPHEFLRGSFCIERSDLTHHACRLQQGEACGGPPRLERRARAQGTAHTVGAGRRSGPGCVSMHVRTCAWSQDYGHIFRSVHFPVSHAQGSPFRKSGWDSRERSMVALVSLALFHLAFEHKKSPAGAGSHKASVCFTLSIIILS